MSLTGEAQIRAFSVSFSSRKRLFSSVSSVSGAVGPDRQPRAGGEEGRSPLTPDLEWGSQRTGTVQIERSTVQVWVYRAGTVRNDGGGLGENQR